MADAVLSFVGLFYYLGLAAAAYVHEPSWTSRVSVPWPLTLAILGCLLAVIAMGLAPRPILDSASRAATVVAAR